MLNTNTHYSMTGAYTRMTHSWLQKAEEESLHKAALANPAKLNGIDRAQLTAHEKSLTGLRYYANQVNGRFNSRFVNLAILPLALLDTIYHFAMGILNFVAAPVEVALNAVQKLLGRESTNHFTFSAGMTHLKNGVKHAVLAVPGSIVGMVDPERAANWFETQELAEQLEKIEFKYEFQSYDFFDD